MKGFTQIGYQGNSIVVHDGGIVMFKWCQVSFMMHGMWKP
jgi:hypothetical protein